MKRLILAKRLHTFAFYNHSHSKLLYVDAFNLVLALVTCTIGESSFTAEAVLSLRDDCGLERVLLTGHTFSISLPMDWGTDKIAITNFGAN